MTEYNNGIAPSNDIQFRQLILQYYNDCVYFGTQLMVYVTAETRKGPISSRSEPFKIALANLLYYTKNIKIMEDYKDEATEITKWLQTTPERSKNKQTEHYLKGIEMMDKWTKNLISVKIIEFR